MGNKLFELKVLTSETCGCCGSYKCKIEKLINDLYPIDVEYVDINDADMDLSEYDFKGLPFTFVYVDGVYHHHFQGDMDIELIKKQIGIVDE